MNRQEHFFRGLFDLFGGFACAVAAIVDPQLGILWGIGIGGSFTFALFEWTAK